MTSLPAILGLLVTAQNSLSRKGRAQDAADLGESISALLDNDLENPTFTVREGSDRSVVTEYGATIPASLAVRTAANAKPLNKAEQRQLRRRLKMHPPKPKRWTCCDKPSKKKTRKGKTIWGTTCRFTYRGGKKRGSTGGMWITLSRDPSKRPPMTTEMGGRRMKTCRSTEG